MKPKIKERRPSPYRGNKQKGDSIVVSSHIPSAVARVLNAECLILNKSVSKIVSEILVSRYFVDKSMTTRKPIE